MKAELEQTPPAEAPPGPPPLSTASSSSAGGTAARAALGVAPERPERAPVETPPAFPPELAADQNALARDLAERARESAVRASFMERIAASDKPATGVLVEASKDDTAAVPARYAAERPNFAPPAPPGLSVVA